jgi:hypothetical protein
VIDHGAAALAFRNRILTLSVATTGSTTLSATALGFARASGSFITDGFYQGMEVAGTGFSSANNAAKVITGVTAQFLTIAGGCTAQSATAGRTLTVGVPSHRTWTNKDFTKVAGYPYSLGVYSPSTKKLTAFPAQGGSVTQTGEYVFTYYALQGCDEVGIWKFTGAIEALFTPGTTFTAGSHTIRVSTESSTEVGDIMPLGDGWSTVQVKIPWWAMSINAVAA